MLWLFPFFLFPACDRSVQNENRYPEDVKLTKTYFDLLRAGKYDEVEKTVDPAVKDEDFRMEFDALVGTIPAENPLSTKTTVAEKRCQGDECICHVVVEYKYTNELLLFNVAFRHLGTQASTVGIHIRTIPASFIVANEFHLVGKGFAQYAMLAMAVLVLLVGLYALVACIRSDLGTGKWLWLPFILFGVSKLAINWTTGQFDFTLIAIQLLSANASSEQYGPWTISVSLPIGAILFLSMHIPKLGNRQSGRQ